LTPDPIEHEPPRENPLPPVVESSAPDRIGAGVRTSEPFLPGNAFNPRPVAREEGASGAGAHSAKDDLGVNAQLLVTHLLTNYADILPRNPRQIIRVASAWAMLRTVAASLNLDRDSGSAQEILVRAAVTWVRFPVLVDELLDADSPPIIDPGSPDCPPRWRRPDVQQVVTMRNGKRIAVEHLALYYGTYFAPPVAPANKVAPEPPKTVVLDSSSKPTPGD
jgi:hypothetical protein